MVRRRARLALRTGALALLGTVASGGPATAQPVVGGFGDATVPGRGEARIRVIGAVDATKDQFGTTAGTSRDGRSPLGAAFSLDSIGPLQLPLLVAAQGAFRDSIGIPAIGLSLGAVTTNLRRLVLRVPVQMEIGITRRLSLGVTVPFVRTRQAVDLRVNPTGATGNIGVNPALADTATGARAQNQSIRTQLATVANRLAGLLTTCPATPSPSTPPECARVTGGDRAAAAALVASARTASAGVARLYGTDSIAGQPFVPIAGTAPQRAVEARIRSLARGFASYQVAGLDSAAVPAASTARIATPALQGIVTDLDVGIFADSIGTVQRAGLGDVEAEASFLWLDTFGPTPYRAVPGVHVRSTLGAGYRFATGSIDAPFNFFDVATGTGANVILLRSATDVAISRRFWATITARLEQPLAATQTERVPGDEAALFVPVANERPVERRIGRQITVEATPRWTPNESFAVSAHYAFRTKQDDEVAEVGTVDAAAGGDVSALALGTGGRAQMLGFGLTYSTLAAFSRGRAWVPAEVSFLRTSTVAGSGGVVPRTTTAQIVVRVYAQLLGRSARRAR